MSTPVCTFDVWDTCLFRATGSPRSVFLSAAREALGGDKAQAPQIEALTSERERAECLAREGAEGAECNIDEILRSLGGLVGADLAKTFIDAELRFEQSGARANVAIREEVALRRAEGAKIAFISDMYLPSGFLHDLLGKHGFALPADPVFVSGEHRTNKHSGGLFDLVKRSLPIKGSWVHYGDNGHSDVRVAERHGAKAVEIRAADWSAAERRALTSPVFGERIAGAMRSARLSSKSDLEGGHEAFFANIAAPWLLALTTRTIRLAREDGRRRIYFLSRDGEIPFQLARLVAPVGIECRYLMSSRKAWCFPAMTDFSEACTSWLKLAPMRPGTLLASLGFDSAEQEAIANKLGLNAKDRETCRSQPELGPLWAHLENEGLDREVIQRAAKARACFVDYLRSEGLFDGVPWAVADVGWSLHSQAALNRVLTEAGAGVDAHGLYFMIRKGRRPASETGPTKAWVTGESPGPAVDPTADLFESMSPVIEECLMTSSDPSVIGYRHVDGTPVPMHSDSVPTAAAIRHARELRTFAESFAREIAEDASNPGFIDCLGKVALDGLVEFLLHPSESEAATIQGLEHATAPGAPAGDTQPMVRPYTLVDATKLLLRRAGLQENGPDREPYWHGASMAMSPRHARAGMRVALAPNPIKRLLGKSRG